MKNNPDDIIDENSPEGWLREKRYNAYLIRKLVEENNMERIVQMYGDEVFKKIHWANQFENQYRREMRYLKKHGMAG